MLLETERLVLRRFRQSDAAALAEYRSDPLVARYQSWASPMSLEQASEMMQELAVDDPKEPGWFQYAIEIKNDGQLAGDIGVGLHDNRMQAELGFTLARRHQRQGYATEAVRAMLGMLFAGGLHRVSAECDARNDASARLLHRVGFRLEGHRLANTWIHGEWTDDLLFGLLAEHWQQRNGLG